MFASGEQEFVGTAARSDPLRRRTAPLTRQDEVVTHTLTITGA